MFHKSLQSQNFNTDVLVDFWISLFWNKISCQVTIALSISKPNKRQKGCVQYLPSILTADKRQTCNSIFHFLHNAYLTPPQQQQKNLINSNN